MKQLDANAFNEIAKLQKNGMSYVEITPLLSKGGYVTKMGKQLSNSHVSRFMIDNGVRKITRPAKSTSQQTKVDKSAVRNSEDFMLDVLASTKLTREQKIKVLAALL